MEAPLIIFIIVVNLALAWLYKFFLDKYYSSKIKNDRKYLSSILALNISHIHDAANFFTLIKNRVEEKDAQDFAKGASYHFRALFEELKQHKTNFDDLGLNQMQLLYRKENIDLKDLLELELLQLSSSTYKRIIIQDKSLAEHAIISGNFSLLSKAILNLVENAIKHTEKQIKLELSDKDHYWQIRINSYGKSIPDSLVSEIASKEISNLGHGLSSLAQIVDYHGAELEIDTFAGEGTCISIKFPKYNSRANKLTAPKPNARKIKIDSGESQMPILTIVLLLIACAVLLMFFIDHKAKDVVAVPCSIVEKKVNKIPKKQANTGIVLDKKESSRNLNDDKHNAKKPQSSPISEDLDSLITEQDQDIGLEFEL